MLNVVTVVSAREGGGNAERTFQMSRALAYQELKCTLLTLGIGLDAQRLEAVRPANVVALDYLWLRFNVPRGAGERFDS